MIRKFFSVIGSALILSGCSISAPSILSTSAGGSIWKSFDAGATFAPKVTVNEQQRISSADVLVMVFDPHDPQTLYIGTKESGIFRTADGAEHWERLEFPPIKTYGLAIDQNKSDRLYASGVYDGIAKMYRSEDAGKNWKEIYTEPGTGTVITALGSSPDIPETIYAGTSAGVVIKSTNGGETWKNVLVAKGPVTKMLFHKGQPGMVTLLVLDQGAVVSSDGGGTWSDHTAQSFSSFDTANVRPTGITTIASDPGRTNVLYAGATNGLFRSDDNGKNWRALDIIESSKKFPVRAITVSPLDSNEIIYASGNAFYRSVDGGVKWATTQLEIDRGVNVIEYEPTHPQIIYFGLRAF